jgi:hypothetical protein
MQGYRIDDGRVAEHNATFAAYRRSSYRAGKNAERPQTPNLGGIV